MFVFFHALAFVLSLLGGAGGSGFGHVGGPALMGPAMAPPVDSGGSMPSWGDGGGAPGGN